MEIKNRITNSDGKVFDVVYRDAKPGEDVSCDFLRGVHAFCFYGDKMLIVANGDRNEWTPPGGSIEPAEKYEEASFREVKEESNMKIIHQECIGYQDIFKWMKIE